MGFWFFFSNTLRINIEQNVPGNKTRGVPLLPGLLARGELSSAALLPGNERVSSRGRALSLSRFTEFLFGLHASSRAGKKYSWKTYVAGIPGWSGSPESANAQAEA